MERNKKACRDIVITSPAGCREVIPGLMLKKMQLTILDGKISIPSLMLILLEIMCKNLKILCVIVQNL